jgi:hypothetical protein
MRSFALFLGLSLSVTGCSALHKGESTADLLHLVPVAREGTAITVPVRVAGRDAVALQFDLLFDAASVEISGSATGPAALRAGKELTVRPVTRGVARVVVYGANLDALPEGNLGSVQFHVVRHVPGLRFFAVRRAAPDAAGRALPSAVRPGLITIGGGGV